MSTEAFDTTIREHEGEIEYTLSPPNKPVYPNYDEDRIPHDAPERPVELMLEVHPQPEPARDVGHIAVGPEVASRSPRSSAEKNANERRFMAAHRARTAHEKQILPGQRM